MGRIPKPELERDLKLIADYLLETDGEYKYTISQLGVKYARLQDNKSYPLTATRIHQILNKHGVEKNRTIRSKE